MGRVYIATQTDGTSRQVAVKFIRPDVSDREGARKRFWREIRIMAAQTHPNVATVFFAGTATMDGVEAPYFAMELVDGRPLHQLMGQGRCVDLRLALRLAISICQGLRFLHSAQVIHRDLKPSNIFVLNIEEPAVKLLDFGLARRTDPGESRVTATNIALGTP